MNVAVLGSGSRGNAILVATAGGTVLIDAGFGLATLTDRAASVGSTLDGLTALLLTHEHGDHARGAGAVAADTGCRVLASAGTLRALEPELAEASTRVLGGRAATDIGPLRVSTVQTSHDAAEPLALLLTDHDSGGRLGIAYDVGRSTPQLLRLLRAADCVLLEANHDEQLLRTGPYPVSVRSRIAGPNGHLSNWQAGQVAAELYHEELQTVVLAHLSERCNHPELARDAVSAALSARGFVGRLLVASQHRPLEPFPVRRRQLALDLFG
jgi:phosphoribosyl 1,2-cyclic phosphodiesterase